MIQASDLQDATLAIDATGIGRDIMAMFNNAHKSGLLGEWWPIAYVITGAGVGESSAAAPKGYFRVSKTDLVARLIATLEQKTLVVPAALPDAEHLERELANFRRTITKRGLATYAAEGTREHDDLVSALMLSMWRENPHSDARRVAATVPAA
jgi:hypothetical protein